MIVLTMMFMGGFLYVELTFFAAFVLECVSWQLFSCGSFIFDEAVHAVRKLRTGSMEYFNFIGEKDTII